MHVLVVQYSAYNLYLSLHKVDLILWMKKKGYNVEEQLNRLQKLLSELASEEAAERDCCRKRG